MLLEFLGRGDWIFFPEVIMTMIKLDWLNLVTINGVKKTRIEHCNLPPLRFAQYQHTWGEAVAITIKTGKDRKTGGCGVMCMFVGYTSNCKGDCYRIWNPKNKMVSETRDMLFFNRMCFKAPGDTPDGTELESVQQYKRGGTLTANFGANNNDTSAADSINLSVPDTPMVNSNPGRSKFGCMYRLTMQYDHMAGHTIGPEATILANYYQCLEEMDGKMEFVNIGAGIGGGFERISSL
jgi:hypothetical protein